MRAKQNKLYNTFVKGLITEAGYLTYPENASVDELNTVLSRKGNRTRRFGIDYETDYSFSNLEVNRDMAVSEFVWKAVDNDPSVNFLCVQTGSNIHFYDLASAPISDSRKAFSINLITYKVASAPSGNISLEACQFASGKGYLFVVHPLCEPIVVEYDSDANTIDVDSISILIRDFEGMEDGLPNDEEPTSLSKEHHYNLKNQGWVSPGSSSNKIASTTTLNGYDVNTTYRAFATSFGLVTGYQTDANSGPIFEFFNALHRYPGNNKQWWVARAEADDDTKGIKAGDFMPEILDKLYSGNNRAPRGHYVVNPFKKDRAALSGITDIPVKEEKTRPNTVAFFSGRAWYAHNSNIYFTQILDSKTKVGFCYQEADPTSEDISDLVSSDGGQVFIPEADKIVKIMPHENGILVFAQNGVWAVVGGQGGFTASDISINKVSSIGTKSPFSIVAVDNNIFWWSEIGINALAQESSAFGPIPGKFGNTNIAEQTVQSFFNEIPDASKLSCKAVYDTKNNVIQWLFKQDETINGAWVYDSILLYDVTLQAFYPWKVSQHNTEVAPIITGFFLEPGIGTRTITAVVLDENNNQIVNSSLDNLVVSVYNSEVRSLYISYITNVNGDITFSKFDNQDYCDWETYDGEGLGFESFVETGYEILADTMRRKQAVYVFCHFRRTEDDTLSVPSSCKFRVKWDWAGTQGSNKWSSEIEAYRPRVYEMPTPNTTSDFPVVTSKNKVRGSGKAIQFRFGTNEKGKTFDLLGWSTAYVGNTEP